MSIAIYLLLLWITASDAGKPAPTPKAKAIYAKASFVPPAAPTLVSPVKSIGWPSAANHPSRAQQYIIATGYGTYYSAASTSLLSKKKKGAEGGVQLASKKGKILVQLLETVPKVGQTGDIVFVSSAVFQNQLKRSNKARIISEEEVQEMDKETEKREREQEEMAMKTKALIEKAMLEDRGSDQCDGNDDICGVALTMRRKAGSEGILFGGVNPKMIMKALKEKYPEGSWDGKQVKLTKVKDMHGQDVKKKDIKHTGRYLLSITFGKGIDVTFILSISPE